MPRPLKYILYSLAFVGSFVLFVYWMFPMEAVKTRIVTTLENYLGPGYEVHIREMGTHWITGARLKDLSLFKIQAGKQESVWKTEELTARVGLFSLLFGNPQIRFETKMGKAKISGSIRHSEQATALTCFFKNLDLSKFPIVKQTTGLELISAIEGEMQMNYDAKQPLRTVGKIEILFEKLFLKGGDIPLGEMGTFPLPDLSLAGGNSILKGLIDKGAIQVESLRLKGDDFNLDLNGKVFLAPMVSRYRMNLQGKFQFSPKLWGAIDPILPEKWLTELKKQKGTDDTYPLSVSGQLVTPQIYSGAVPVFPFKPF